MKILGMGVPELLIILAVILVIFGPKNLPKLGGALGKTVKNLRDGMASKADDQQTDGTEGVTEAASSQQATQKATPAKNTTAHTATPIQKDEE